ncbi:MYB-like transcription factor ETC1 isoform X2 [Cannabis sativa]|uniref:MYB-like transcription factor ETC1 isoform X2 n=1 Tax=Cannabis sativa TaxID=3483 RepID=UPI0011DF29AD|nr:MYB-like transcription factor ETC1 isoform X2 [Cannabis sativa]
MADSEHSSCDDNFAHSQAEEEVMSEESIRREVVEVEFSEDEESLIIRMFNLIGERWSLIAGRIPGRTAEEIEKYWVSKYSNHSTKTNNNNQQLTVKLNPTL